MTEKHICFLCGGEYSGHHSTIRCDALRKGIPEQALPAALADIAHCQSAADLVALAGNVDRGPGRTEFNFWAEVTMAFDPDRRRPVDRVQMLECAAEGMLQQAFLNAGVNPPCSFIMECHRQGWHVAKFGALEKHPL